MKFFEHVELTQPSPEEAVELEDTEAERRLELLQDTRSKKIEKGLAVHPYENLEICKALRNVLLERLADLEIAFKRQKEYKTEDFQLMSFMLKEGYFKDSAKAAAKAFVDMDGMKTDARDLLEQLREMDDQIGMFEEGMGMSPEDLAAHAEVRRQHWQAVATPWGMN